MQGCVTFLQLGRFGNFKGQRREGHVNMLEKLILLTLIQVNLSLPNKFGRQPYSAIVYCKSLKRNIGLVHVSDTSDIGKLTRKIYFCTDNQIDAFEFPECYQGRFQIEFLYRDDKQHTVLTNSQACSENKLNFHFNAALTAINIAKTEHCLSTSKDVCKPFSITTTLRP